MGMTRRSEKGLGRKIGLLNSIVRGSNKPYTFDYNKAYEGYSIQLKVTNGSGGVRHLYSGSLSGCFDFCEGIYTAYSLLGMR